VNSYRRRQRVLVGHGHKARNNGAYVEKSRSGYFDVTKLFIDGGLWAELDFAARKP